MRAISGELFLFLPIAGLTHILRRNDDPAAFARADELITLAQEEAAPMWRALALADKGCLLVVAGKASDAVETITSGIAAWRLTGASVWMPFLLVNLAEARQN
jgi:hypothetical protein